MNDATQDPHAGIGRRGFVGSAIAGALVTSLLRPTAAPAATVPHGRRSSTITPAVISAELMKEPVACAIDLTTVETTAEGRLRLELLIDGLWERTSVREVTDKIEKLALVHQELHRPPTALLTWGTGLAFTCIVESALTGFTMFGDDGSPLRATMAVELEVLDR